MSAPTAETTSAPEAMLEEDLRKQYEDELRRECEDLEGQLRTNPLRFQNEALEVQLVQMQDDYIALQEDFRNMREYFSKKLAEMKAQLEDQTRTAGTSRGHADCLYDLLPFHEDQGQHVDSYWRAQCEKRDDSIRFLTLKLQEYTVPSATYRSSRRKRSHDLSPAGVDACSQAAASCHDDGGLACSSTACSDDDRDEGSAPGELGHTSTECYSLLELRHRELCTKYVLQEAENLELEAQLEAIESSAAARSSEFGSQRSGGLFSSWMLGFGGARGSGEDTLPGEGSVLEVAAALGESAPEGEAQRLLERQLSELETERVRLEEEVNTCEGAMGMREKDLDGEPLWAARCIWRDQLDVRAGQLERISLQFDATKRQLDAANEELQWQATSAEALRMRLADVLRQTQVEEVKVGELREEHRESQVVVEELAEQWKAQASVDDGEDGRQALPLVVQQAQWLLEALRRQAPAAGKAGVPNPEGAVPEAAAGATAASTGAEPAAAAAGDKKHGSAASGNCRSAFLLPAGRDWHAVDRA